MARENNNICHKKDKKLEAHYIKVCDARNEKEGDILNYTCEKAKNICQSTTSQILISPKKHNQTAPNISVGKNFSVIAEEWFEYQQPQLKQSSVVKYKNMLNSYILPELANINVSELTKEDLVIYANKLLQYGGIHQTGLSSKTVISTLSIIKNILSYANQIKGYSTVDINGISIKQNSKSMRILSRVEQKTLCNYLCKNPTPCNLGILVCLYTGLRVGEICAVKWGDISFEEQYLYVHQTMQRLQVNSQEKKKTKVILSTPKSECSIRKVPIPDVLFFILKKHQEEKSAFLLTGMNEKYMEPRTMQNKFKAVIKKCQIEEANFHALRHTFATRCVELGFDIKSLSEILGHASVNITLNRYVHPSMELKQRNMNMLSELIEAI